MTDQTNIPEPSSKKPGKRKLGPYAWLAKSPYVTLNIPTPIIPPKLIPDSLIENLTRQVTTSIRLPAVDIAERIMASYRSPFLDIADQLHKQMQAQLAPTFELMRKAVQDLWPKNWGDARPSSIDALEAILTDEGIPLLWVPGPKTVEALFKADTPAQRRRAVSQRWKGIVSDCEAVLRDIELVVLQEDREFAQQCVRALRDGHNGPAQALAANLLDTVLTKYFEHDYRKKITDNWFRQNGTRFDFDDYGFRAALTLAPVWCAHAHFFANNGDPIPSTFGRHPSAHAVSRAQYNRINAVIGLMVVTSVIKFCDVELRRKKNR